MESESHSWYTSDFTHNLYWWSTHFFPPMAGNPPSTDTSLEIHLPGHPTCLLVYFWAKPSSFCHLPRDLNGRGLGRGAIGWGRWHGLKWPKRTFRYDFLYQLSTPNRMWFLIFDEQKSKNLWVYMDFCLARIFFRNSQVNIKRSSPMICAKKQTNKQTKHLPSSKSGSCR